MTVFDGNRILKHLAAVTFMCTACALSNRSPSRIAGQDEHLFKGTRILNKGSGTPRKQGCSALAKGDDGYRKRVIAEAVRVAGEKGLQSGEIREAIVASVEDLIVVRLEAMIVKRGEPGVSVNILLSCDEELRKGGGTAEITDLYAIAVSDELAHAVREAHDLMDSRSDRGSGREVRGVQVERDVFMIRFCDTSVDQDSEACTFVVAKRG